jgi:predicted nucleic acid-binding protein
MAGATLDASALIALDRGDRRVIALMARAADRSATIAVPATALAQAIRAPERQALLARLIRQQTTHVEELDRVAATDVGRLLGASGTSDITDAHVVICARRHGHAVVTSDAADLRRLDPGVAIVAL